VQQQSEISSANNSKLVQQSQYQQTAEVARNTQSATYPGNPAPPQLPELPRMPSLQVSVAQSAQVPLPLQTQPAPSVAQMQSAVPQPVTRQSSVTSDIEQKRYVLDLLDQLVSTLKGEVGGQTAVNTHTTNSQFSSLSSSIDSSSTMDLLRAIIQKEQPTYSPSAQQIAQPIQQQKSSISLVPPSQAQNLPQLPQLPQRPHQQEAPALTTTQSASYNAPTTSSSISSVRQSETTTVQGLLNNEAFRRLLSQLPAQSTTFIAPTQPQPQPTSQPASTLSLASILEKLKRDSR
jgi:hypothetical protein